MTLGDLFMEARQYGLVRLSTMDDGTYHCSIKFNTIQHTALEARSTFKEATPEAAIKAAIIAAQSIVDSIQSMAAKMPERKMIC